MPELVLHPRDVVLIGNHLKYVKSKPKGLVGGLWSRLKSGNRWKLERLSMQDLRALAIVAPALMPELGLWEPAWSVKLHNATNGGKKDET
jgi:hypothetical protein